VKTMRRRIRTLRAAIHDPADVWLAMRMAAWAVALPALKHLVPLHVLARWAWPRRRAVVRSGRTATVVFLAARIYRARPFLRRDNCLERSLLTYRFLAGAGVQPRLVLGAQGSNGEIRGHAWVTVDGIPITDGHEALEQYTQLVEFGERGSRSVTAGS
jgi:Transglutaminase-like superfamily